MALRWKPRLLGAAREPRWGRNIAVPGEDPYHSGEYAAWVFLGPHGPPTIDYVGYEVEPGDRVARLAGLPQSSESFFQEFVLPRRPVLISVPGRGVAGLDAALGWHTSRWTDEYLVAKAGEHMIAAETPLAVRSGSAPPGGQNGSSARLFGKDIQHVRMPFGSFVEASHDPTSRRYYLNLQDVDIEEAMRSGGVLAQPHAMIRPPLSALTGDMNVPSFILTLHLTHVNMWYGVSHQPNGSRSQLHNDGGDNLYVLLNGTKRLTLFSPADAVAMHTVGRVLHVNPNGRVDYEAVPHAHFGQVDVAAPDLDRFPHFVNATPLEVTVQAGEMLYIPAGWFHQVTSVGKPHVALNFWFDPPERFDEEFEEDWLFTLEKTVRSVVEMVHG
eukprot:g5114.t1